ncbi:MAG: hypothetical protein HY596_00715 [Candidatus Omnitrophica bacterium]|nr:hypothetical protein [Candidatus Omnitrophota bacterium]
MRGARVPLACALLVACPAFLQADEPRHLKVALHIHSTISTGTVAPAAIAALANQAGLDAVVFTDSALRRWEYGLWPARAWIRRVVEQPSVLTFGAKRYLDTLRSLSTPELLVLPGLEAAPFYSWRRSPFDRRGGQIRGWNQHLLVFGLEDPRAIRTLPLNAFDPYQGDRGAAPYQRVIEAVTAQGGLVFWAHPETGHVGEHGPVEDYTDPYPHLLELTSGYHGFAVTYRDKLAFVEAGGVWDRLLAAYCAGRRRQPVWILGELDWRKPEEHPLDRVVTMVMASERTAEAVLRALRTGRMWVVFRIGRQAPVLHRFEARALTGHATAGIGESIAPTGPLRIQVSGRRGSPEPGQARVFLIRDGAVLQMEEVTAEEFDLVWTDDAPPARGFYRAVFQGPAGLIYTNPIFVR